MNKLALATVMTTLVSQAAGCIIETTDRPYYDDPELAAISARWSLRNMVDGATTACPRGFDTVRLIVHPIDDRGNLVGEPAIDLFDCEARVGLATDLFPDIYQVWLEVMSRDLRQTYAQSLSQIVDVRNVDETFSTEVLNDGGYFQLSWDLVGRTSNRPVECSQVAGLQTIKAVSTSIATATRAYDDSFLCEDHFAVSGGLLEGSYTIAIEALAGDKSVGKAAPLTMQKIAGQNSVTDLGTVSIPVDGM